MNISPVTMLKMNQSFGCAKCEETKASLSQETSSEDEIVTYANMGPNYFYPVTASQLKMYEDNIAKNNEIRENKKPLGELEGESWDEYAERHKLEWSM